MGRELGPYALFFNLLEINGLKRNEHKNNKRLFPLLAGILLISFVFDSVSLVMYIIGNHSFIDKAESIQCLISLIHIFSKVIHYRFGGKEKLKRLLDQSVNIWNEMKDLKKYDDFLEETRISIDTRIKIIQGMFILTTPTYGFIVFIRNLTLDPEKREFVFKLWDPLQLFMAKEYYYIGRLIYEATFFTYALFTIGSLYLIYHLPCFMAATQMKVLMKMLSSDDLDITACVKFHQNVLRYVRDMNNLFSGQMFFEIILSAWVVTFRSYQLIRMLANYDPRAVGVFFFLTLCFLVPLLVCISGQMITDSSEELFLGTYQNQWYKSGVKDRKSLCIMMTMASIPLNLCYKNSMTFNMERYMTVVQATYSYITILINYS